MGSHSRTTEVWVALRQRRFGVEGVAEPNVERIWDWRAVKRFEVEASEARLRETFTSTMLPEWMSGGRSMEGNSILVDGSVG